MLDLHQCEIRNSIFLLTKEIIRVRHYVNACMGTTQTHAKTMDFVGANSNTLSHRNCQKLFNLCAFACSCQEQTHLCVYIPGDLPLKMQAYISMAIGLRVIFFCLSSLLQQPFFLKLGLGSKIYLCMCYHLNLFIISSFHHV